MSETGTHSDGPLQTWGEKRAEFERELAVTSDAPRKFELKKGIEECDREIARLEAESQARAKTPPEPARADTRPWNVPIPPNPFFTGRKKVLADVEKELHASGQVALTGMGGVGKTQIAAHLAHKRRDEYSAVLWASAASQETLVSGFAAIASLLNLPEKDEKDQALAVAAVKRWLEANGGWLLIVDNASDLAAVYGFIPRAAKGHVLLTTQAKATGTVKGIQVLDMLPEEGAVFLLLRSKIIESKASFADAKVADQSEGKAISRELGGLPLALDQAGAYIEETGCGLASYLDLYRRRRADLLKKRGGFGPDHPESVAATFALSFERVASASHAAADLLRFCAFLHPDAIPEEIFNKGAAELGSNLSPVAADPLKLDAACAEILKYSLLRRDADAKTLGIHPLVQEVIQDGLTKEEKREWAERAVRAVNRAFPPVEFANWAQCERLVPQAIACASLIGAYAFESEEAARLLNQAGYYLVRRARFSQAEPLLQRAPAIHQKALGPNHPDVATSLNNLAALYDDQGKYAEAEPLYQRALGIKEKTLGPEHPDVATSLNNLAALYHKQGRYAEAEPLFQRALAIMEKALGPDHHDVAMSLNNLAALYKTQGKYAQAEPLYQRALPIWEKVLGPEHPHVATSLNNLAALYDDQRKHAQAEPLYQRALAIREKALGPDHPDVAGSLNNLAELYHKQGSYAQAEPPFQRAIAIWEKALGPEHPNVATALNNLADLYRVQGKYAQAEPLYQRALAIREKVLGPEHPDVAASLNNLAALCHKQGKYAQAEPLYQRAIAIWEKALGPEHPHVATNLNNLAELYRVQGKYAQAEPRLQRALAIREKVLGPGHPDVATSLNNLAVLYHEQGKYAQAEPLYQRALAIKEKALGIEHPDVAASLNNLAWLSYQQGRYAEADSFYQRALAISEKALGPEHPDVARVLDNYARLLREMKRGAAARELEARAQAIRAAHAKNNPSK